MKNHTFEFIGLATAKEMSEKELQFEIGKRVKYLREGLGMDRIEAANFVSSLLNLGVSMNNIFKDKKAKKKIMNQLYEES